MDETTARAIGLVAGALVGVLVARLATRRRLAPQVALWIVPSVLGLLAASAAPPLVDAVRRSRQSPFQRLVEQEMKPVTEDPRFRAAGKDARSAADVQALVARLTAEGIARLDDDTLRRRARVMAKILAQADVPLCAGIARGQLQSDAEGRLAHLLEHLDAAEQREWIATSRAAMLARLEERPARTLADADTLSTLEALGAALPPERTESTLAALGQFHALDADVACALSRLLFNYVDKLPSPAAERLALLLLQP
jgi:hypothetical protein